jgi:hypothetical protein
VIAAPPRRTREDKDVGKKSWAMQDRKHLEALIARAFYSGGMQDRKNLERPFFACAISFFLS